MRQVTHKKMVRTALLLALTLLLQALRFMIPAPFFFSTIVIGSLVNACLLITLETTSFLSAVAIAVITPLMAYLHQLLPLPVFIVPVALANIIYVGLFRLIGAWSRWPGLASAAAGKTLFLFGAFTWLLSYININPKLAAGMLSVMSWPQFLTALAGGIIAFMVVKRLKPFIN